MNKKISIIVGSVVFLIVGFVVLLGSLSSTLTEANKALNQAQTPEELVEVWQDFNPELKSSNSKKLLTSLRTRARELELNEEEIEQLKEFLPKGEKSLNVIVIPDLSRRIIDTINNPHQIENDQLVIETIWNEFVKISKFKRNSSDFFSINVTDLDQAKGSFSSIANNLRLDVSEKNKSNRILFTDSLNSTIKENVKKMYEQAQQKPLGADYKFYFRRHLPGLLKSADLDYSYRNKIILITDGYLEAENEPADTKIAGYEKLLKQAVLNGTIDQKIRELGLNIPVLPIDLSNADVLICEVNERKSGRGFHFEILQSYWTQWLEGMGAKNVVFIGREQSTQQTQKQIREFLKK